eukprot:3196423-Prymnesium_polylepis.1
MSVDNDTLAAALAASVAAPDTNAETAAIALLQALSMPASAQNGVLKVALDEARRANVPAPLLQEAQLALEQANPMQCTGERVARTGAAAVSPAANERERSWRATKLLQALADAPQSIESGALRRALEEAKAANVAPALLEEASRLLLQPGANAAGTTDVQYESATASSQNMGELKYAQLALATGHFAAFNKLGEGGGGSVFRGNAAVIDGLVTASTQAPPQHIAVKCLTQDVDFGRLAGVTRDEQLQNELRVLRQLVLKPHANLVPLVGWATDGPVPCIVYALMDGGSLEDRLSRALRNRSEGRVLSYARRLVILSDVARGLAHLHHELKMVHRDVKSANVLLTAERSARACVGDFGLARSMANWHRGQHTTMTLVGTNVYMAPEYLDHGELSVRTD